MMNCEIESLLSDESHSIRAELSDMIWEERGSGENLSNINVPAFIMKNSNLTYDEKRVILEIVKMRLAKIINHIRADLIVDGQPGDSVPDNMTASEKVYFNEFTKCSLEYLARVRQLMIDSRATDGGETA